MSYGAVLSDDGNYRYRLWRTVSHFTDGRVLFVMLNPSTADASEDDPTIRRCMNFARKWGYSRIDVVNLFAWRATEPKALETVADPVGPDNDYHIIEAAMEATMIIAAWGEVGGKTDRSKEVMRYLDVYNIRCLGTTKDGSPRHPLYVKSDMEPVPYSYEV